MKRLWSIASALVKGPKPGDLNQGLMELGALVCLPKNPDCQSCPIRTECKAYEYGQQDRLPVRRAVKAGPHYDIAVGIIFKRGRLLIAKRKPAGLLGGLWELPGGKREKQESLEQTLLREVCEETGLGIEIVQKLEEVDHAYSHFSITLYPYVCQYRSGQARPRSSEAVRWIWPSQIERYTFPAANHKIFRKLRSFLQEKRSP